MAAHQPAQPNSGSDLRYVSVHCAAGSSVLTSHKGMFIKESGETVMPAVPTSVF